MEVTALCMQIFMNVFVLLLTKPDLSYTDQKPGLLTSAHEYSIQHQDIVAAQEDQAESFNMLTQHNPAKSTQEYLTSGRYVMITFVVIFAAVLIVCLCTCRFCNPNCYGETSGTYNHGNFNTHRVNFNSGRASVDNDYGGANNDYVGANNDYVGAVFHCGGANNDCGGANNDCSGANNDCGGAGFD